MTCALLSCTVSHCIHGLHMPVSSQFLLRFNCVWVCVRVRACVCACCSRLRFPLCVCVRACVRVWSVWKGILLRCTGDRDVGANGPRGPGSRNTVKGPDLGKGTSAKRRVRLVPAPLSSNRDRAAHPSHLGNPELRCDEDTPWVHWGDEYAHGLDMQCVIGPLRGCVPRVGV